MPRRWLLAALAAASIAAGCSEPMPVFRNVPGTDEAKVDAWQWTRTDGRNATADQWNVAVDECRAAYLDYKDDQVQKGAYPDYVERCMRVKGWRRK